MKEACSVLLKEVEKDCAGESCSRDKVLSGPNKSLHIFSRQGRSSRWCSDLDTFLMAGFLFQEKQKLETTFV